MAVMIIPLWELIIRRLTGGIYDNPDVTIREALHDILEDLKSQPDFTMVQKEISKEKMN